MSGKFVVPVLAYYTEWPKIRESIEKSTDCEMKVMPRTTGLLARSVGKHIGLIVCPTKEQAKFVADLVKKYGEINPSFVKVYEEFNPKNAESASEFLVFGHTYWERLPYKRVNPEIVKEETGCELIGGASISYPSYPSELYTLMVCPSLEQAEEAKKIFHGKIVAQWP